MARWFFGGFSFGANLRGQPSNDRCPEFGAVVFGDELDHRAERIGRLEAITEVQELEIRGHDSPLAASSSWSISRSFPAGATSRRLPTP